MIPFDSSHAVGEFHHTGLAVANMNESLLSFRNLFGSINISKIYHIASQQVNVCFVRVSATSYIELVEPASETSKVNAFIKKRIGFYHCGFMVEDIESAVEKMVALDFKPMEYFASEAFSGNRCIFLISTEGHLYELIEKSKA